MVWAVMAMASGKYPLGVSSLLYTQGRDGTGPGCWGELG